MQGERGRWATAWARRLWSLVIRPQEAWEMIAAEPGEPAAILLPLPAALAAVGPVSFLVGHGVLADASVPFGRALAFAVVYYAFLFGLLLGFAQLIRRLGPTVGCLVGEEEALKLAVYGAMPFLLSGFTLLVTSSQWESVVMLGGLLGVAWGAFLLYKGLRVLARGDQRSRTMLAVGAAGGLLTSWILGFFLLIKIIL